jgi:hypothetical protein
VSPATEAVRSLFLLGLVLACPAAAQTPLCAWNGTGLTCPGQPAFSGPLTPAPQPGALPTPTQRLAQLQAHADFDRALAAAEVAQDTGRAQTLARADALIAAGDCTSAEALVRDKAKGDLAAVASRCAAARK